MHNFFANNFKVEKLKKVHLALISYLSGYFGICSKAFMKLESLPTLSSTIQDNYAKLALQIFMKFYYF